MTKTQSWQMKDRAFSVSDWMRDTGDFTPEQVEAAEQVAIAIAKVREEYGYE